MKKLFSILLWLLMFCQLSVSLFASWPEDSCKSNSQQIADHIMQVRSSPLLEIEGLTTISVSDFGAIPDDGLDDYSAIQAAMEFVNNLKGNVRLVFSKGQYEFDPGSTNTCILISKLKNVIIDGQGSSVLIKNPSVGFCRVVSSENVIVRNFTIDYDPLPFSQGTVKAVHSEGNWFEVEVDEGYPALDDIFFKTYNTWGMLKDPDTPGKLKDGVPNFYRYEGGAGIGGDVYRYTVSSGNYARVSNNIRVGDRWAVVGRSSSGCFFHDSDQVTFDNITYYACPSSLFSGSYTSRLNIINCHARLTENRLLVNGADGVHCQAARIGPWIEGCVFEGLSDDCLNVYAPPAYVSEIIEDNKFRMTRTTRMLAGDTLVFFRPQTGEVLSRVRIESVLNDVVTLSQAVTGLNLAPAGTPYDSKGWKIYDHAYNIHAIGNYFVYRNNHMSNGRRHGGFIKASYGVIENNHFEGLSDQVITIKNIPAWPEGFWGRNIVIRNNQMIDCGKPAIDIRFLSLNGDSNYKGHQNIFLEDNLLRVSSGPAANISNVDGLVISNNVFETPFGPRATINNVNIHCMENNTGEETFQMSNVDFITTGLNPFVYPGSLQIYPNPAKSEIYVKPGESIQGMLTWFIYNVNGSELESGHLFAQGYEQAIDISGLKTGMYLIELNDGQMVQRLKFLKE